MLTAIAKASEFKLHVVKKRNAHFEKHLGDFHLFVIVVTNTLERIVRLLVSVNGVKNLAVDSDTPVRDGNRKNSFFSVEFDDNLLSRR